ncbi:MAG TPA: SRPBCC domain-containing protein [Spirochaetia bacterium]|nr:SRPBCC domain-containing protein [Spirochaetia bacterium]
MPEIIHRLGVQAAPARVYRALATRSGLINWWTWHVTGEPAPGVTVRFRFGPTSTDMKVLELLPEHRVSWRCVAGGEEWTNTDITFELTPGDRETIVHFSHTGWSAAGELMAHWNCKWGYFLLSLKTWVEDGRGTPFPEDRKISSWG